MWIFAYGSLMADGWEAERGSTRRVVATLHDHERSFTKASTVNWGSKSSPAPTLRIVPRTGAKCVGIAFEFPRDRSDEIFAYLTGREGKGFARIQVRLTLSSGESVDAFTYRYDGKSLIPTSDLAELARMAFVATGSSGSGRDYVRQTKDALAHEGLSDTIIDAMADAVAKVPE